MFKSRQQIGFTLVEVLVTLVITSVALLSSASLQLLSKRSMYDSAQRTTAAHLANDLFSRMRANPANLAAYIPGGTIGTTTLAVPGANCLAAGVVCSDAQMAIFDLWQWEQHLDGQLERNVAGTAAGGLTNATACITGPVGGGTGNYTVAIAWRGMSDTVNPVLNNCGVGVGNYGAANEYRRIFVVQSFISAI
jgi:type IV pilus assembly protein PilV